MSRLESTSMAIRLLQIFTAAKFDVAKNATPVVITAQHRLIHEAQRLPAVSSLCDATKFVLADPPFAAASVAAFFRVTA